MYYIYGPGVLGVQYMYVCMHVCMYYVYIYAIRRADCADRYSARRSLFGALIGALGDMDVSQVEYVCIISRALAMMHHLRYLGAGEILRAWMCDYYLQGN